MSDPQSYCPFCKRTHDAPEFIETLKRIANELRNAREIASKYEDRYFELRERVDELEAVREHAGRFLRDPNWDTHRKNLIKAITDSYVQANIKALEGEGK